MSVQGRQPAGRVRLASIVTPVQALAQHALPVSISRRWARRAASRVPQAPRQTPELPVSHRASTACSLHCCLRYSSLIAAHVALCSSMAPRVWPTAQPATMFIITTSPTGATASITAAMASATAVSSQACAQATQTRRRTWCVHPASWSSATHTVRAQLAKHIHA